ncbi:hypothetical protein ACFXTO_009458 [Malus domestica]|uniref:Uncharacterized protein n=1 Tax=Malus domestica TaxID=3750 RepID=A0A498ID81_MALDO|nr:hypothetical protein DVH24_004883 [Malus domestica]
MDGGRERIGEGFEERWEREVAVGTALCDEICFVAQTCFYTSDTSIEGFIRVHGGAPRDPTTKREPTQLLDLFRTRMVGPPPSQSTGPGSSALSHSFCNRQELQAAGIHFRLSEKNSLRDINFKLHFLCWGFIYLPKIIPTKCVLISNDFEVTFYLAFFDSLIDHPDNVKHLRKKRLVQNLLGSDKEVTQLFNEICTDLVPNDVIYRNVTAQIENHCKIKLKTWMVQFFHDHFSSPWTFLAFIGVLLGLWLELYPDVVYNLFRSLSM